MIMEKSICFEPHFVRCYFLLVFIYLLDLFESFFIDCLFMMVCKELIDLKLLIILTQHKFNLEIISIFLYYYK